MIEELNAESRNLLAVEFERARDLSTFYSNSDRAKLLISNFLREISDTLARIDEKLGGIEMNGRPGP